MKEKLTLCVEHDENTPGRLKFFLISPRHEWYLHDNKQIKIAKDIEVEYEPPQMSEDELRLKAVEQLRDRQKRVRADASKAIADLDEQINKLMLITYQPESVEVSAPASPADDLPF